MLASLKSKTTHLALGSAVLLLFAFCKKEEVKPAPAEPSPSPAQEFGNLNVEFVNTVENEILELGKKYLNPSGDTFTVSKFNYYISNVVLVKEDDSLLTLSNTYYLIEASKPESAKLSLGSIPFGKYKAIRFLLGVDSLRNVSGAQTGALDPAKGMFWNWSTGYIMLKLEGLAPTSTAFANIIEYHLGGFKGTNKVLRDFEIGWGSSSLEVVKNKIATLRLQTNINEMFRSPNVITFSTYPVISSVGANAKMMADNYQDMITFKNIE